MIARSPTARPRYTARQGTPLGVSVEKGDEAPRELRKDSSLPRPVRDWRIETGLDRTDDPAVRMTLPSGTACARKKTGGRAVPAGPSGFGNIRG